MNKQKLFSITFWVLILLPLVVIPRSNNIGKEAASQSTKINPHVCPFDLCPYKGYPAYPGVIITGDNHKIDHEADGTDTYYIDLLHFKFPTDSYDQLEDKLFSKN